MAKKVVSSVPSHKVKLMKRGKKKKLLLKRVIDYMKSDTYMFAPLLSSQSSNFCSSAALSVSSSGVGASEPILKKNENLLRMVKDYMLSDQFLYASLVTHQRLFHAAIGTSSPQDKGPILSSEKPDTSRWKDSMKKLTEEVRDPGQKTKVIRIEDLSFDRNPYSRTNTIRHTQMQKRNSEECDSAKLSFLICAGIPGMSLSPLPQGWGSVKGVVVRYLWSSTSACPVFHLTRLT